jgi:uncharacterized protein YbaP (TraB family)
MKTTNITRIKAIPGRMIPLVLLCLLSLSGVIHASPPDDTAIFWSISSKGEPAGYLLGTIHSEDPRVLDFSEDFSELLSSNRVFAMEMVPDLPTLQKLTGFMQYQDGTTLEGVIGKERYAKLKVALADYRVPADWIARMKVWAAMMSISVPPPETGLFMDFSLSLRAAGSGLKVVGLETLEQQLAFLENMPLEQQLILLDQALAEYKNASALHDQMVDSYLHGDLQALSAQASEQLGELGEEAQQYFLYEGVELRNRRMIDTLLPILETDRVFVAVGALHLPGNTGLIQLLRDRGYELQPLPQPFSAEVTEPAPVPAQQQRN